MAKSKPFPVRLDNREQEAVAKEQERLREMGLRGGKSEAIRSLILNGSTVVSKPTTERKLMTG